MYYLITGTNVKVTGTVQLKAGISVTLKPGFTAVSGCSLKVVIDNALIVEPEKYYYVKDHLGSTRVTVDEAGGIASSYDYDPWGMLLDGRNNNFGVTNEKYKFTGKERDDETNYDYFGARYYDSRIGRWFGVDPLAEKYPGWNPYNYCINQPLIIVDPNGEDFYFYNSDSAIIAKIITGDDKQNNIYTGLNFSVEKPLELNIEKFLKNMNIQDVDAIGISFEGSFSFGGGWNGGTDYVYFLDGDNKGELHQYGKWGVNVGLEGSVGAQFFWANNRESKFSFRDWEGWISGYSGGIGPLSFGYFWGNKVKNSHDLWPNMYGRDVVWEGGEIGRGISVPFVNGKWYTTKATHWRKWK